MTIDRIPNNYIDSLIKAVLIILPHSSNDIQKSPFGFDFFLKKVISRAKKNHELTMSQQSMIVCKCVYFIYFTLFYFIVFTLLFILNKNDYFKFIINLFIY